MTENNIVQNEETERAIMAAVYEQGCEDECERSLDELARLADTAGAQEFARVMQMRDKPDARTILGSGKLAELAELCGGNDISLVIFDCELSPSQIKCIEDDIKAANGGDVSVIDRSMLILDIFAQHATTNEGKLQVELAQLKYTAPRLIGKGRDMSRIGSGSGGVHNRGAGESKLEMDRRRLKTRASALEDELDRLDRNRKTMRASRDRSGIPKAAIVGYTNAGKSTLLNRLTDAGILAEDKLFATLDPTTRKFKLPSGLTILLTDTVGFVRRLPHHLINAFKSTLDEAVYADMLVIIADASDDECDEHLEVTAELMKELGAADKPTLYVFNKCDNIPEYKKAAVTSDLRRSVQGSECVFISALTGEGIDELTARLETMARDGKTARTFVIPNDKTSAVAMLYKLAEVKNVEYGDESATVTAIVDEKVKGQYAEFLVE